MRNQIPCASQEARHRGPLCGGAPGWRDSLCALVCALCARSGPSALFGHEVLYLMRCRHARGRRQDRAFPAMDLLFSGVCPRCGRPALSRGDGPQSSDHADGTGRRAGACRRRRLGQRRCRKAACARSGARLLLQFAVLASAEHAGRARVGHAGRCIPCQKALCPTWHRALVVGA